MIVETLLVVFLAPAFTAGAISLEREKQTLDMLTATPISSLAIVIGKLVSALTYVFILIVASIPLTAIVFVFGGVGPDEVLRGYIVLFASAIGLGSLGLFISALMQRTQAATVVTFFGVMALTMGTLFIVLFWTTMAGVAPNQAGFGNQGVGPIKGRPPEALLWFNPFAAQYDVICGASDGYGGWCSPAGRGDEGCHQHRHRRWCHRRLDDHAHGHGLPGAGRQGRCATRQGRHQRRRPGAAIRNPTRHVLAAERRRLDRALHRPDPGIGPTCVAHAPLATQIHAAAVRESHLMPSFPLRPLGRALRTRSAGAVDLPDPRAVAERSARPGIAFHPRRPGAASPSIVASADRSQGVARRSASWSPRRSFSSRWPGLFRSNSCRRSLPRSPSWVSSGWSGWLASPGRPLARLPSRSMRRRASATGLQAPLPSRSAFRSWRPRPRKRPRRGR